MNESLILEACSPVFHTYLSNSVAHLLSKALSTSWVSVSPPQSYDTVKTGLSLEGFKNPRYVISRAKLSVVLIRIQLFIRCLFLKEDMMEFCEFTRGSDGK